MYRVLMVCTGNTCRSPMAAGILRMLLQAGTGGGGGDSPRARIEVSSAGVAAGPGSPASPDSVAVCRYRGIDLSAHHSRQLTAGLLRSADLVIAMESHHRQAAVRVVPEIADRIATLAELAGVDPSRGIPDPIGGDRDEYEGAFDLIEEYIRLALPAIRSRAEKRPDLKR